MPDNDLQKLSPAYRLPASDPDFILSDSMQGVRFLLEFAKADERLRSWGVRTTIVVLGSARIREANGVGRGAPAAASMAHWYDESRRFGRIVSERGGALAPIDGQRDNVIATGGGLGIMEAANRGASDVGAPSIGFNIQLPREQEPNPYSTPELTFQFHSFTMRKMHLAMRAAGVVAFPGGFGTLAELFEVLTLVQTRKGRLIPLVCVDRSYWTQVINFDALLDAGVIAPPDFRLLRFAEDAEEAWQELASSIRSTPVIDVPALRAATRAPSSRWRRGPQGPPVSRAAPAARFYVCSLLKILTIRPIPRTPGADGLGAAPARRESCARAGARHRSMFQGEFACHDRH